jgi:hypothetical protein
MRMPAKSTVERTSESKRLDAIAMPLIPLLGVAEAYRRAIQEVNCPSFVPRQQAHSADRLASSSRDA